MWRVIFGIQGFATILDAKTGRDILTGEDLGTRMKKVGNDLVKVYDKWEELPWVEGAAPQSEGPFFYATDSTITETLLKDIQDERCKLYLCGGIIYDDNLGEKRVMPFCFYYRPKQGDMMPDSQYNDMP